MSLSLMYNFFRHKVSAAVTLQGPGRVASEKFLQNLTLRIKFCKPTVEIFQASLAVAHFPASLMMFRKKVIRENMDNNLFTHKNSTIMTAFSTSFLTSSADAASRVGKKGYRSSKSNNFQVEVVDLDNAAYTFEVEAESASQAAEQAEEMALAMGVMVSYCNVYRIEQ